MEKNDFPSQEVIGFLTLSLFRRYSKNRPSVLLWGMLLG